MMNRYMQVVWLYLIGVVIIFIGLYLLVIGAGGNAFIFMLVGLLISTIGAAHGKKMREEMEFPDFMREEPARKKEPAVEKSDDMDEPDEPEPKRPAGRPLISAAADIVELICPKCEAENDEKSFFCWNCGFQLRRRPAKTVKGKPDRVDVAPETIEVIGGKRVAKVVICPKCNVSNKDEDKFCWNCGKKLKSERVRNAGKESI